MRWKPVLGAALAVVAASAAVVLPADAPRAVAVPNSFVTGWVPHWETTRGIQAMDAAGSLLGEVMPFWYSAKPDGSVSLISGTYAPSLDKVVAAARENGQRVLPSIVDAAGPGVLASILSDPGARAAHVQAIVNVVMTGRGGKSYDGIDIDYEGFAFDDGRGSWPATQPHWIAFVKELGAALHAKGKLLSITVPPMWNGGDAGYWVYGPCSYDVEKKDAEAFTTCMPKWNDLLTYVDRWRLMVYDWSLKLVGPIAPMFWVDNVISYVQSAMPAGHRSKVQLGVPSYGRRWAKLLSGTCPADLSLDPRSVLTRNAQALADEHGADIVEAPAKSSGEVGEKTFTYRVVHSGTTTKPVVPPEYVPPANRVDVVVAPADPDALRPALRLPPIGTTSCEVEYTVYFPDTASIVQRVDRAYFAGLGGAVIWALGYETPDLWTDLP